MLDAIGGREIKMIEDELVIPSYTTFNCTERDPSGFRFHYTASLTAYMKINKEILITGQTNQPSTIVLDAIDENSFAVTLPVGFIKQVFAVPAYEFTNHVIPLSDMNGLPGKEEIIREIHEYQTLECKVKAVRNWLSGNYNTVWSGSFIHTIIGKIINESIYSVKTLSSATGYSERQLQRIMLDYTGFSPKLFMEIVRFKKCKEIMENGSKQENLTPAAYTAGYFDQSHMIRDFIRFAGNTPGLFNQRCPIYTIQKIPSILLYK